MKQRRGWSRIRFSGPESGHLESRSEPQYAGDLRLRQEPRCTYPFMDQLETSVREDRRGFRPIREMGNRRHDDRFHGSRRSGDDPHPRRVLGEGGQAFHPVKHFFQILNKFFQFSCRLISDEKYYI